MDQQLIYRKTVLGEEAIQSRAKLSEHELRVILIMVDGKKTVGEMITKFGNMPSVEQALYRLERDGFIRPIAGSASEHEVEQSKEQLEALFTQRASAPSPEAAAVQGKKAEPVRTVESAPQAPAPAPAAASAFEIPPIPSDDELAAGGRAKAATTSERAPVISSPPPSPFPAARASLQSEPPPKSEPARPVPPLPQDPTPSSWDDEDEPITSLPVPPMLDPDDVRRHAEGGGSRRSADQTVDPETRPGSKLNPFSVAGPATAGGFEQAFPEKEEPPAEPKAPLVSFQMPRRRRGMGKIFLAFLLVLLIAPVVVFLVYPFDSHRGDLEAMLSEAVGQPVKLSRLNASLSPKPAFVLDRVSIGKAGEVTIREVRALPDLLSLLGERIRFDEIQLNGLRVPVERLGMLSGATAGVGSASAIAVRSLRFSRITLVAKDLELADYSGRAQIDDDGRLRLLSLTNGDGTLTISVVGDASGNASVLAEGEGWKPSPGSPFVFEWFKAAGRVDGNSLITERIEGRLFGGVVRGSMRFAWGDRMTLATDIASEFMNTPVLLTALRVPAMVDGQIDGRVRFDVEAESWSKLVASVPMAGEFLATKGNLKGMDLVEAVRRAGQQPYRGGGTKFDSLRGRFAWDGKVLRLSQIDLSSGIVGAYGGVQIDSDGAIGGEIDVLIKASSSRTREAVRLSGTLKDPELSAGR